MNDQRCTIDPKGDFDLARSIGFLEEWPAAHQPVGASALRFAFCVEHDWRPVGVRITQDGSQLDVATTGPGAAVADIAEQVARILSVDIDGTALSEVTRGDPIVAQLVRAAPGLRPVCFWTPWEAACWAVLSQRTSMRTASVRKQRISKEYGTPVIVDGAEIDTFPAPSTLLAVTSLPGVNPIALDRIHGLAAAALDGTLTARSLRAVPAEEALATLRQLPGVGPFSAGLILIRGAGAPDVFPTSEPRLLAAMRKVYHLPEDAGEDDYRAISEHWRPLRSWVSFLLRAASARTLDELESRFAPDRP